MPIIPYNSKAESIEPVELQSSSNKTFSKLTNIKLGTFSDYLLEWTTFRDLFHTSIRK